MKCKGGKNSIFIALPLRSTLTFWSIVLSVDNLVKRKMSAKEEILAVEKHMMYFSFCTGTNTQAASNSFLGGFSYQLIRQLFHQCYLLVHNLKLHKFPTPKVTSLICFSVQPTAINLNVFHSQTNVQKYVLVH